ncbi:MAG TPA: host-nuclease inhibitor Gam family protein, partial [Gemmatimonadaceae bacterium]|nr:host-nuclease inhibitor Gam family protein [Gemmatimonadaceae bacterium]
MEKTTEQTTAPDHLATALREAQQSALATTTDAKAAAAAAAMNRANGADMTEKLQQAIDGGAAVTVTSTAPLLLQTGPDSLIAADEAEASDFDAAAGWALRTMALAREEGLRLQAARDAEVAAVQAAYAPLLNSEADTYLAAERRLRRIVDAARAAGHLTKKQTRATARGTFGWKSVPERVKVTDEAALLAWAEKHRPDLIETKVPEPTSRVPQKAIAP